MPTEKLLPMLARHEGFRAHPYRCTAGKLTIGYGRNIEDRGITEDEANLMLRNDVKIAVTDLTAVFADFGTFPTPAANALIDMMFNLGLPRFREFKNMIAAINGRDWNTAADEMLDSKWHDDVGDRAEELAALLRSINDAPGTTFQPGVPRESGGHSNVRLPKIKETKKTLDI